MLVVYLTTFTVLQDIQGDQTRRNRLRNTGRYTSTISAVSMGFGYLAAVISGAMSFVGWIFMPGIRYVIFTLTWVLIHVIVRVSIPNSAEVHEMSKEKSRVWKFRVHFVRKERSYMKRLLETLKPLSFKCGDIGPLCAESKKIYLYGILSDTTDLLLLCKSF